MRKFILIFLLAFALVLPISTSFAIDVVLTGAQLTITYTEPIVNSDASPLVDLDKTTIFVEPVGGNLIIQDVPATALTGGGTISQTITVPVPDFAETNVNVWANASDITGNVSANTPVILKRIDRLPPGAPQ